MCIDNMTCFGIIIRSCIPTERQRKEKNEVFVMKIQRKNVLHHQFLIITDRTKDCWMSTMPRDILNEEEFDSFAF